MRVTLKTVAERQCVLIQNIKNAAGGISGSNTKKIQPNKQKITKTKNQTKPQKPNNSKEVDFTVKNRMILKSRL